MWPECDLPLTDGSAASPALRSATHRTRVRASAHATGHLSLSGPYIPPVLGPSAGPPSLRSVLHACVPATCRRVGSLRGDVLGQVNVNCASGGHRLQTGRGCVVVLRSQGGGGVRLGALSLPGTRRADQEPDGDASGGGFRRPWVDFRRLHPHQNPGAGDLPGKDRAPNLGPGLRACARLDRHAAPAFPVQVEFHPHIPLRIPDRLHDQRTGDHQSSLTPHQIPGTHRTRQPLITPRTTAGTRPKQNTTAIVAATAAEAGSVVGVGFGVLGGQSGSCGSASGASPARPGSSSHPGRVGSLREDARRSRQAHDGLCSRAGPWAAQYSTGSWLRRRRCCCRRRARGGGLAVEFDLGFRWARAEFHFRRVLRFRSGRHSTPAG